MNEAALPRNGCYNREPLRDSVKVQAGWDDCFVKTRNPVMVHIPDPMSKDCQYSRTTADERCDGCKWRQALEAS
jgi:hypothetical protein